MELFPYFDIVINSTLTIFHDWVNAGSRELFRD